MDTCDSPFRAPQGCRNLSLRILHLAPDTKPFTGIGGRKPFLSSRLPRDETCSTRPHPGALPVPPRTLSDPTSGPHHRCVGPLANAPGGSSLSRPSQACLRGPPSYQMCPKQPPRTLVLITGVDLRKVWGEGGSSCLGNPREREGVEIRLGPEFWVDSEMQVRVMS